MAALRTKTAEQPAALTAADLEGWDALAVAAGRPFCTPAWALAYWHEARLGRAVLRVVVVRDGEEVVAVAPTFLQLGRHGFRELRLLAAGTSHRLGVLCAAGREHAVTPHLARALVRDPAPHTLVWEGVDARDPWPGLLGPHLGAPLGAAQRTDTTMAAPVARLPEGDFDAWLATRSGNARSELRRTLRRLESGGGAIRRASAQTADADVDALGRLHEARWRGKGGSAALDGPRLAMLRRAVREGGDRVRLWIVDLGGEPIGAGLFACAGGVLAYWGGGMAPEHEKLRPGQLAIVGALRDALARGERVIDFGGGDSRYKRRFADEDEPVVWRTTLLRDARYPLTRAQLAPKHARWAVRDAVARMPPERRERVKTLLRRG